MRFKTTQNIFKDFSEFLDHTFIDSDKKILPETKQWDYMRPMKFEDVDIWEVLYEQGGGVGIYAAWSPYAEFYMIRVGWFLEKQGYGAEIYYGPGSMKKVIERAKELNIPLSHNEIWVESDDLWLYQ